MAKPIYRNRVSYSGVLHDAHNDDYLRLVEGVIAELGDGLELSWGHSYDLEDYEDAEELEEEIAENPWQRKSLRAEGEPQEFVIFFDDQSSVDLTGASDSWVLLVNGILRELEEHNVALFGEGARSLDLLNS